MMKKRELTLTLDEAAILRSLIEHVRDECDDDEFELTEEAPKKRHWWSGKLKFNKNDNPYKKCLTEPENGGEINEYFGNEVIDE